MTESEGTNNISGINHDNMAGDKYSPSKELDKKSNDTILDLEDRHHIFSCIKISTLDKLAIFFAEVIGTGLLLFIGCAGCISWNGPPPSMNSAITFGLAVMLVIQVFGAVSGAHLNPAVTVSAVCYRLISPPMSILYIVAQIIGSFLGFGLLKVLTPPQIFRPEDAIGSGVCSTVPHDHLGTIQVFAVEFFATMSLILLCCGVWDPRNAKNTDSNAIKFGFTIIVLSIAAGPFTGCSMNPARTLGPAIWNGDFTMHWVYWVAPILSAVLTTILYRALFWRETKDDRKMTAEELCQSLSIVQTKTS